MSLREIDQAIAELPDRDRAELVRHITQLEGVGPMEVPGAFDSARERIDEARGSGRSGPGVVEHEDGLIRRRRELAEAAAPYWQGGDGLEYQLRIRAEWDDRTGFGS